MQRWCGTAHDASLLKAGLAYEAGLQVTCCHNHQQQRLQELWQCNVPFRHAKTWGSGKSCAGASSAETHCIVRVSRCMRVAAQEWCEHRGEPATVGAASTA